jgi:type II secretory pathway pseudopilin PulG
MKFELAVGTIFLGALSYIAIPNLLTARNRSHQKRTMANIRTIATAWEARAADVNRYDVGGPTPAPNSFGGVDWKALPPVPYRDLKQALEPTYVRHLPEKDGWGEPFQFAATEQTYAIRSLARNGIAETEIYGSRTTTDFDSDFVFSNGTFIWYPEAS